VKCPPTPLKGGLISKIRIRNPFRGQGAKNEGGERRGQGAKITIRKFEKY